MSNPYDDELEDRVIARALDADETDEAAMDRATLDEYRRVLALLPFEEVEPPAALADRVINAALERRPATVRSISRRRAVRWATLGAAVAAAAVVVTFMFTSADDGMSTPGGRVNLAGQARADVVNPVLEAAGVRVADLEGEGSAKAALTPEGKGALYDLQLDDPGAGQVLWIWLVTADRVVPIDPLPDADQNVSFTVTGDVDAVTGIAISSQPEGEVPSTPGPIAVSGSF